MLARDANSSQLAQSTPLAPVAQACARAFLQRQLRTWRGAEVTAGEEGGVGMELGNCAAASRNQSSLVLLQRLGVILLFLSGDNLNHLGQRRSVSFS